MSYNYKHILRGYKARLKWEWEHMKDYYTLDEYAKDSAKWINEILAERYIFDYRIMPEEIKGWLS